MSVSIMLLLASLIQLASSIELIPDVHLASKHLMAILAIILLMQTDYREAYSLSLLGFVAIRLRGKIELPRTFSSLLKGLISRQRYH